jgi:hypothetical protein
VIPCFRTHKCLLWRLTLFAAHFKE